MFCHLGEFDVFPVLKSRQNAPTTQLKTISLYIDAIEHNLKLYRFCGISKTFNAGLIKQHNKFIE